MAALCGGVVGSSFCRNYQLFRLLHKSFIGRYAFEVKLSFVCYFIYYLPFFLTTSNLSDIE